MRFDVKHRARGKEPAEVGWAGAGVADATERLRSIPGWKNPSMRSVSGQLAAPTALVSGHMRWSESRRGDSNP
jgi:hypothetical protein